jgi:hypothetical protein
MGIVILMIYSSPYHRQIKRGPGEKERKIKLNKLSMKGIFWNYNGLRDLKKHRLLLDLTKENDLDLLPYPRQGGIHLHNHR